MMTFSSSTSLFIIALLTSVCYSDLDTKFSQFEILRPRQIVVRVQRGADGQVYRKQLTLRLFGRKISLVFKPGLPKSLLSQASLYALHGNGTRSIIRVEKDDFNEGTIRGYPDSWVSGIYNDGLWSIQAFHPTMSFSIEPLTYHMVKHGENKMIAYRNRDMNIHYLFNDTEGYEGHHFCEQFQPNSSLNHASNSHKDDNKSGRDHVHENIKENRNPNGTQNEGASKHHRDRKTSKKKRRAIHSNQVCGMLVIADYRFFNGIGGRSVNKVAKMLIQAYHVANSIFASTRFDNAVGIGVGIRSIQIYTYPGGNGPEQFFNGDTGDVDGNAMIKDITKHEPFFRKFCLVHLTTQRRFLHKTMGMALTAHNQGVFTTGICGGNSDNTWNIGISTMYTLVLTHELGHSFGARHDTEGDDKCSPSEADGGKYLMWPALQRGFSSNNRKFSQCSIQDIVTILKEKSHCLIPRDVFDSRVCGNHKIDEGEECDAGDVNIHDPFGCCTPDCKLTTGAVCSPHNHPCCTRHCSVAPKTKKCHHKIEQECEEQPFCDGFRFHICPPSPSAPNNRPCGQHGKCKNGNCVSYCALLGLKKGVPGLLVSCHCDSNPKAMCSLCCKTLYGNKQNRTCRDYGKNYINGTPCPNGVCVYGECQVMKRRSFSWYETRDAPEKFNWSLVVIVAICSICGVVFVVIVVQHSRKYF